MRGEAVVKGVIGTARLSSEGDLYVRRSLLCAERDRAPAFTLPRLRALTYAKLTTLLLPFSSSLLST